MQIIQEVFCWTRKFSEVRRIAQRKEALYLQLLGQHKPMLSLGVQSLLSALQQQQVSFSCSQSPSQGMACRWHCCMPELHPIWLLDMLCMPGKGSMCSGLC